MSVDISNKANINELVINWHMTEVCNYSCKYCFAKWGRPNELHRSWSAIEHLLDNIADYFIHGKPALKDEIGYEQVRLNLAGGEPMLLGKAFVNTLQAAKKRGLRTSIITNGSYLLDGGVKLPINSLDMIGISFDSQSAVVQERIGRNDRKGNTLNTVQLTEILEELRQSQDGIQVKINTVVNALNWQEDFSALIDELKPNKWKVLQVLPYGNNDLLISKHQFNKFIAAHSNKGLPISPESNNAMTESYLMIDPKGRFYQNSKEKKVGYIYSDLISNVGIANALGQISFNADVYKSRYAIKNNLIDINEVAR